MSKNDNLLNKAIQGKANEINYEVFEHLDELSINEIFDNGYENDIDNLINSINEETTKVLNTYSDHLIDKKKFEQISFLGENIEEVYKNEVFNYFVVSCFPWFNINWHHLEWGMLLQNYRQLSIIAAREHNKSMWYSLFFPIWKMYRYQPKRTDKTVPKDKILSREGMLVSNESGLARKFIRKIKEEIEYNDELSWKLKPKSRDGWGIEWIKCKNGAEFTYKSSGQSMRGPHPNYIIVDDFLDKSTLYSNEQNEKFKNVFYSEILNMLSKGGQIVNVGTPFKEQDLFDDLKKDNTFSTFEYPAIFPDGTLLDYVNHDVDEILNKKDSQGSIIFSREILCKPISDASSILPYTTIAECFDDTFKLVKNKMSAPKDFVRIVGGVDLARSAGVEADYSVFITLGVDEKDRYWLLNMWRDKGKSFQEQISALKYIYNNFKHDIIVVESNQMQQFFVDESIRNNIPVQPHTTGANKMDLDKGFPSLAITFEQGSFKIPRGNEESIDKTDILATELASMTWTDQGKIQGSGAHDDIAMAVYMSVIAARKGTAFGFDFV